MPGIQPHGDLARFKADLKSLVDRVRNLEQRRAPQRRVQTFTATSGTGTTYTTSAKVTTGAPFLFRNGSLVSPASYTTNGTTLTVNISLTAGDTLVFYYS